MALRFLLHRGWVIVHFAVGPVTANSDFPAAFLRLAREMEFHQVVAAVSFGARFWLEPDPCAVVLFVLCRYPTGSVPAPADPFGFAGFGSVAAAVVADPVFGLSVADLSVVAVDPGSADSASDFACSGYFFVAGLGRER